MALNQAGRNFPQGPDCAPANICTNQDDCDKVTEYEMLISSLPLSTSTPTTGRTSPQSFSSFVSFLKLDDSGFGETFHSTPSVTASISSHSFQEENGKGGFFSTPVSHISQVVAHRRQFSKPLSHLDSLTDSPYSLPAGPGVTTLRDDCHQSFCLSDQERFHKSQNKFYKICSEWQQDVDLLDDEAYYSRLGCSSVSENSAQSHHSDLVESFNRALKGFSPPVPSKLIGRNIGVETIDIVTELHASGLDVISLLLPYLRPQDVLSMSLVCTLWRHLCLENSRARHKRQEAMTLPLQRNKGKENAVGKESRHFDTRRTMTASKGHLAEIQPLQKTPDATSPVHMINSSPSFLYEQARKSLRWGENFRHCPKCNSAAKIVAGQDRGKCVNPHCWSDFCTRCLAPYHFTKPCILGSMRTLKTELIGSKKSRKNLRRL